MNKIKTNKDNEENSISKILRQKKKKDDQSKGRHITDTGFV